MRKEKIRYYSLFLIVFLVGMAGGYVMALLTAGVKSVDASTKTAVVEKTDAKTSGVREKQVIIKYVTVKDRETDLPKEKEEEIKIEKAKSTSAISMAEFRQSGVVLLFPWNSTYMTNATRELIKSKFGFVASELNKNIKLRIEGHTETGGDGSYNQKLSRQRAEAVADYLVSEYGFKKENFQIVGFGGNKPFTTGIIESEKSLNRRVEISIQ
jgi:outer membrane protein OmpA-like peptidoglycan-associated protein